MLVVSSVFFMNSYMRIKFLSSTDKTVNPALHGATFVVAAPFLYTTEWPKRANIL